MSEISPAKACERKLVVLEARYCSAAKLYMLSCFFGDSARSLRSRRNDGPPQEQKGKKKGGG